MKSPQKRERPHARKRLRHMQSLLIVPGDLPGEGLKLIAESCTKINSIHHAMWAPIFTSNSQLRTSCPLTWSCAATTEAGLSVQPMLPAKLADEFLESSGPKLSKHSNKERLAGYACRHRQTFILEPGLRWCWAPCRRVGILFLVPVLVEED